MGLTRSRCSDVQCYDWRKHGRKLVERIDLLADTRRYLADTIRQLEAINAGDPIAKPLIAAVIAFATLGEAPGPVAALGISVLVGGALGMEYGSSRRTRRGWNDPTCPAPMMTASKPRLMAPISRCECLPRRDLLDDPRIVVGIVEGEERPVTGALGGRGLYPRLERPRPAERQSQRGLPSLR
jgi:hypothetical protein